MKNELLRHRELALGIVLALGLSACGGGGGNVRPAPPPVTPPPPPPATTDDPPLDAQLDLTNTYAAHEQGYTGAGVTIGIIDSGVMRNHPSLAGRVNAELVYVDPQVNDTSVDDVVGHGTWVSQIAAGRAAGQFPGGIAPGASLVSARIIADKEPDDDGSGRGNEVGASDADFFSYLNGELENNGVRVQNNSWGGIYWDTTDAGINDAFAQAYDDFVLNHDGLVVFAAGNEGRADPTDIAALPTLAPELERGWLVAVAADSNSAAAGNIKLADYSNACGKAMRYCLTAPGDVIVTDKDFPTGDPEKDYWVVTGTSFAAPQVSGAAALVWQAYPYFSNDLVRQTLLGTADDLGAPGPDPVFGYGMLNVGKAVNGPAKFDWGDVSVTLDGSHSYWNNDISGAGGLTVQGTGTLTLNGANTYQGMTRVSGGTLEANGLVPGPATVDGAGTLLLGANVLGSGVHGDLTNSGVVGTAGAVGIDGNFVQTASGRLSVYLGGVVTVSGSATLAGDLYAAGAINGYVGTSHQAILQAAGGITGTFATFTKAPNVFLDTSLSYAPTEVWIDTTRVNVTRVSGLSYTAASMSGARRLEGAFQSIDGALAHGTAAPAPVVTGAGMIQQTASLAAAQQSLESLSGQLHAASAAMTFEAIDAGTRALSDRFDRLLDSNGTGGWTQDLGYHGGMTRNGYTNVGVDLSGLLVGQDMRVGNNGVAGFALSRSQGLGRLAESADQGRSHALEGMLYGGLVRGNAYLMGRVGTGNYRETMRRHLQLGPAVSGVASDSHGRYDVAYGESGYRATLGRLTLTPYASLQYARIDSSGFNEPGAWGFGLKANARTIQRWQAGLGVRAARHWNFARGGSLDLQAHLAWQRAFAMRGDVFEASFTGIDQWAPLGGIGLSRYGGVAGMTLDWAMTSRAGLSFGLDHRFAQHERGSMATMAYRLSF